MNFFGRSGIQVQQAPESDDSHSALLTKRIEQAQGLSAQPHLLAQGKHAHMTQFMDLVEPESTDNSLERKKPLSKRRKYVMESFIRDKKKLLPKGYSTVQGLKDTYKLQKEAKLNDDLIYWDLNCHTKGVTSVVISNDGKRIISGSMDSSIRIFDIQKKAQIKCISTDQSGGLNSISLSDDASQVACATDGDVMMVFDLSIETPERLQYVGKVHQSPINFVRLSDDKKYLFSSGLGGTVKIYDLEKKQEVYEFQNSPPDKVGSIVMSNDGNLLAFVTNNTSIRVYDIHNIHAREEVQHFDKPHSEEHINSLAISNDNKYLITGSTDVKVFNLKTKHEIAAFQGFQGDQIKSMMVSNENRFLVIGSGKGSIKIFDLDAKQQVHEYLNAHQGSILSIAISKDDKLFVTGSEDTTIKLFSLYHCTVVNDSSASGFVGKLAVSKDSRLLISSFEDCSIRIGDLETGQELHHFEKAHEKWISGLKVTSDNKYLISVGRDCVIKMFDIVNMKEVGILRNAQKDEINSMAISANDKYILTSSYDGSIKIIEIISKSQSEKEFKEIYHFEKVLADTTSISLSKDNKFIIACSSEKSVKVFDFDTKEQLLHIENLLKETAFASFVTAVSSDGKYLVAAKAMEMKMFNLETKKQVHEFEKTHLGSIAAITLSDDDRYIITAAFGEAIRVFDLHSGEQLHHYSKDCFARKTSVAISPDNQKIIVGSEDGAISALKLEALQQLDHITNDGKYLNPSLAVTNDGKHIIMGFEHGAIRVFNSYSKKEVFAFKEKHRDKVNALVLSKNNKFLVSISDDGTTKIFDFRARTEIHTFHDPQKEKPISLAISSDDSRIVTGTNEGSIKVFDLKKNVELHSFPHTPNINRSFRIITAVVFSPDNKYIISASSDDSIKIWDSLSSELVFTFNNAHQAQIGALAVTHDSKLLISSSKYIESVKVWDLESMQEAHHFGSNQDSYYINIRYKTSICITKDDRYAFVLLGEESPKVYDLKAMQEAHRFNKSELSFAQSAVLTEDDKLIVTRQVDGSVKFHRMPFTQDNQIYYVSSKISTASLVGVYDTLLFKQCNTTAESLDKFLTSYHDLYVAPHNWTILHLMAIFRPYDISKVAIYPQYKAPFLVDAYGKTPLHYLVAHDNLDYSTANLLLKYTLDYLENRAMTIPYECKTVCNSLTDLFPFIIAKATPRLTHKYLELCFQNSTTRQGEDIPSFGAPQQRHIFSKNPSLLPDIQDKLYEEGDEQVTFKTTMLHLDYHSTSDDMINNIKLLTYTQDEEIFKTPLIKHLIDHMWRGTQSTMIMIALLFSVLMTLIAIYVGIGDRDVGLEIVILILASVFATFEGIQVYSLRGKYLRNVWNYIDIAHISLVIAFIIMRFAETENRLAEQWVISAILIVGFMRWVSYLRLFTPTNLKGVLIQIIIAVLRDMTGFIIIIISIIIGFSLIFLTFNRDDDPTLDYSVYLYSTYKILYGDTNDEGYNVSQSLLLSLILFMLNVVLLNLLISIMGDAYSKVLDQKVLIDSLTRLEMILDAAAIKRVVFGEKTPEKGYLIYCEPESVEEEDLQKIEWEERIQGLKSHFQQNIDELKTKIEKTDEEIRKKVDGLERLMITQHREILNVMKSKTN